MPTAKQQNLVNPLIHDPVFVMLYILLIKVARPDAGLLQG